MSKKGYILPKLWNKVHILYKEFDVRDPKKNLRIKHEEKDFRFNKNPKMGNTS